MNHEHDYLDLIVDDFYKKLVKVIDQGHTLEALSNMLCEGMKSVASIRDALIKYGLYNRWRRGRRLVKRRTRKSNFRVAQTVRMFKKIKILRKLEDMGYHVDYKKRVICGANVGVHIIQSNPPSGVNYFTVLDRGKKTNHVLLVLLPAGTVVMRELKPGSHVINFPISWDNGEDKIMPKRALRRIARSRLGA